MLITYLYFNSYDFNYILILLNCMYYFSYLCDLLINKHYFKSLQDERFGQIKSKIDEIIHEDTYFQKGALNMRTQKCFAVRTKITLTLNRMLLK